MSETKDDALKDMQIEYIEDDMIFGKYSDLKRISNRWYELSEIFDLWIAYLNYYNITFQELSRTSNIEYSFPK